MTSQPLDSLDPVGGPGPETPGTGPASVPAADFGRSPADDDSNAEIDQYMQELLNRINQRPPGTSGGSAAEPQSAPSELSHRSAAEPPTVATHPATPASGPLATSAADDAHDKVDVAASTPGSGPPDPQATPAPPAAVAPTESVGPRATPPERHHDLAAMRQLANHSARDAIAAYESKQMVRRACSKLCVALLAMVASVLLFSMAPASQSLTFIAAVFALAVAVVWGSHNLLLWGKAWWKRPRAARMERATADEPPGPSADLRRPA